MQFILKLFTFRDGTIPYYTYRWLPILTNYLTIHTLRNCNLSGCKKMSSIGYARVSSYGQSLEVQLVNLSIFPLNLKNLKVIPIRIHTGKCLHCSTRSVAIHLSRY